MENHFRSSHRGRERVVSFEETFALGSALAMACLFRFLLALAVKIGIHNMSSWLARFS